MRNLLIVFLILCLILLIMIFPFKTRMMGHINLIELKCYYSVKSWILKLLCGKIVVENGKIEMSNEETFLSGSYNKDFIKIIIQEIISKLDVKKVELYFTGGIKENSYASAIMCGSVITMVETLYGFLSLKFDDVKMYKDIQPTFDETNLELTADLVISISLIGLFKCFLKSSKRVKELKEVENEG